MSSDFHVKLAGVEGESTHKDHKGEIEIHSWNWSVNNPSSGPSGGGMGQGKPMPGELMFSHNYDKASPTLAKHCVKGTHFDSLDLTCRKSGEGQQDYLKIKLKEAFIRALSPSGATGGDVVETVVVAYKDIEFTYKVQTAKGTTGPEVKFGWDVSSTQTR